MIEGTKFKLAGVELDVDRSQEGGAGKNAGLFATLDNFKKLSRADVRKLVAAYGFKIGKGTSSFDLYQLVAGEIQNEWYASVKGEVPMAVAKNQESRKTKAAAEKKETEAKAPRQLKTYKLATGKTEEIKALKGQGAMVVAAVKLLGKADVKAVGEQLVANPDFKTKQSPERVAGYYFTVFAKDGLLVEA